MTQEDKELLLKDLCARLPYGVVISLGPYDKNPINVNSISIVGIGTFLNGYFTKGIQLDFNGKKELWPKPYLRTMSSMTEEEYEEYEELRQDISDKLKDWKCADLIDWFNAHHFDYRGLIEKGLAIAVTEEMYK